MTEESSSHWSNQRDQARGRQPAASEFMRKPRTAKAQPRRLHRLVQHEGWAVEIRRKDGSTFFAASGRGVSTPVWNHGNRSYAYAFVRELKEQDLDATIVRVAYAEPKVLTKSCHWAICENIER